MDTYPKATKYEETFVGITKPKLIKFDDNRRYVVKFKNNLHKNIKGTRVLINEFIVSEFLNLLDNREKIGRIVEVEQAFIDRTPELKNCESGLQFGSFYIANTERFSLTKIAQFNNLYKLTLVLIIDALFDNNDRNEENLLLEATSEKLILHMIDHSDIFGGIDWDVDSLQGLTQRIPYLYPFTENLIRESGLNMETMNPYLLQLERIDSNQIAIVINKIPDEWNLSDAEKEKLIYLIDTRKNRIRESIESHFKRVNYEEFLRTIR